MKIPEFWKTSIEDVTLITSQIKKGVVKKIGSSAGNRDITIIEYGEKQNFNRKANYNSACGAGNPKYYADKKGKKPVIMLICSVHSAEMEGIAAAMNLVNIIEKGMDFTGTSNPFFENIIDKCRLLIVPIANPDGRARLGIDSVVGMSYEELRHFCQGRWKDGTLCGWPECKTVHPIKDYVSFMGGYYNDNGVNLMHDNFFAPMADETKAIFKVVDDEAPDYILVLHGGTNTINGLLQPDYVPMFINEKVHELNIRIKLECEKKGLKYQVSHIPSCTSCPPKSFNLISALHHICGCVAATYESNQGLNIPNTNICTYEEILTHHYLLFEQTFKVALG